jgi:hypothetical protein
LADNFKFWRTISEFGGQFQILADYFGIWRTISNFGGQFRNLADNFKFWRTISEFGGQFWKLADNCPRTIVYIIYQIDLFFNTDNLYIHNFRGQFQNLTDNSKFGGQKFFFLIFGGQF